MKNSIKQRISIMTAKNRDLDKKLLHMKGSFDEVTKILNKKKKKGEK